MFKPTKEQLEELGFKYKINLHNYYKDYILQGSEKFITYRSASQRFYISDYAEELSFNPKSIEDLQTAIRIFNI